ncbi:MAG: mycothiol synthase [Intrasporangium sp.]|uniref:mycothiol synthase n=1 Tax=Intrasporangium sp. TaxID=1925024 RepID=UPI002649681F|nr:mycothiol synthase [Intrasporangium sp.]MDN5795892.1 mycothiol synthase [Intrasporangium sp.]
MSEVTIERRDARTPLSPAESHAILRLAEHARQADSSAALSEQFRLSVESRDDQSATHLLAYAAPPALAGYAQSRSGGPGEPASAEIVVDPDHRGAGVGAALLAELPADVRLWSHDSDGAATAFARTQGFVPVRELHFMGRSLTSGPAWPAARLPGGFAVRRFEPGRDEHGWLRVNAAAFAHHPEQGALGMPDLEQRMAQPWFDPDGFILVVRQGEPDRIAAFHWTKVDPPGGPVGEVYVVGVAPEHQGLGLGTAVTVLGLDHLRQAGQDDVVLYVDQDNTAALHTYRSLGFGDLQVHRQFARP